MTYTYDADGNRVEKSSGSSGTLYWYGAPGILAESDLSGTLKSEYVFFGGKRVARIDSPGNSVHYYLSDHLNSTSMVVSAAGAIEEESDYSPFGTEYPVISSGINHYKFIGKERDTETGIGYFGARYYSSNMGSFMSPDWSDKPQAVPYSDLSNPQSLNLYSYGANNPLRRADENGHCSAPSVAGGHVGICLESYIQMARFGFLHIGHGDNRGPVANDPNATFRTQTMIDINLGSQSATEHSTPGLSVTDTGSRMGVVHDWIDGLQKGSDGSTTFTVHVYGENGYEADHVLLAPGGWIEMVFTFKVTADGKVSVVRGSSKKFPSVSIYSYQSNGTNANIFQQKESGNINDLNKPMSPVQEDANRLCVLGNPAACDH